MRKKIEKKLRKFLKSHRIRIELTVGQIKKLGKKVLGGAS